MIGERLDVLPNVLYHKELSVHHRLRDFACGFLKNKILLPND